MGLVVFVVILVGLLIFIIYKANETRKTKTSTLVFVGQVAVALDEIGPRKDGFVLFNGEHWKAQSNDNVLAGQKVKILSKDGYTLIVTPLNKSALKLEA